MRRLRLQAICPDSRVFRADGQRLRDAIEAAWTHAEPLEVDFEHETLASIAFLDQGIATLFVDHDAELIRRRLHLLGLAEGDRQQLNSLVARRRAERAERIAA
jgi:hypothetical protein